LNISKPRIFILLLLTGASFVVSHIAFIFLPNVFNAWNSQSIDQLFVFRNAIDAFRPAYNQQVVHVDLNDTSTTRLGDYHLNRSHFARAVENLSKMDVAAQLYDFIFAGHKQKTDDDLLIQATRSAGNVYFGFAVALSEKARADQNQINELARFSQLDALKFDVKVIGEPAALFRAGNPLTTFDELSAAASGSGSISVKFDNDGVLRRVPLLVRFNDNYLPLLSLRVVCDYLKVPPWDIILHPGKKIILKNARKPGDQTVRDITIPINAKGNMIVNFIGPWERMDHYNFSDILTASDDRDMMDIWKEELSGKIVIISDVSTGSTDIGSVPLDSNYPLSGVHANVIHNILTESYISELTGMQMIGVEVLLMSCLLFMGYFFRPVYFSVGVTALAGFFVLGAGTLFCAAGIMLNIIRPLMIIMFSMISMTVYRYIQEEKAKIQTLRQRDFIREVFGRYLSSEVVDEILETKDGLKMSGETREVTTLVSDLRGFTALSAMLTPAEIITMVNRYFECMTDIIKDYHGTVNEFLGDGILIFFGAPLTAPDDPERAVACAIAMQNALIQFNVGQRKLNLPELAMGIGINTGDVVVGNIGSEKRAFYTALGTEINITYRIESYTVGGQVLISQSTYDKVSSMLIIKGTKEVRFKGIDRPIVLYEAIGTTGSRAINLKIPAPDVLRKLALPVPVSCFSMTGKIISDIGIAGHLTCLGRTTIELVMEQALEPHANMIIRVEEEPEGTVLPDLYAKVLTCEPSTTGRFGFQITLFFTWMPEKTKHFFVQKN